MQEHFNYQPKMALKSGYIQLEGCSKIVLTDKNNVAHKRVKHTIITSKGNKIKNVKVVSCRDVLIDDDGL